MRFLDRPRPLIQARVLVTILLAAGLAGCGSAAPGGLSSVSALSPYGPQADYPVLVGDPYEVAGTQYTPADVLNYDEVGYLTLDPGAAGYTGAHHTLPVPSYVEVTSLDTGRTVLVRLERRGPMDSNHLLALSPAAMAQLGANIETPVRVRRVNPPEQQRAMLRRGEAAPLRMDTPASLLSVLRRRLPESGSASLAVNAAPPQSIETVEVAASTAVPPMPATGELAAMDNAMDHEVETGATAAATVAAPALATVGVVEDAPDAPPAATVEPQRDAALAEAPRPLEGGFMVQAAAFANPDNARRAADALGATVITSGKYHMVRTGPFATREEAEASLANVRRAGYSDARILTSG